MWFEQLVGFKEGSPEQVRSQLMVDGDSFISLVTNKRITFGQLEIPTLSQLEQSCPPVQTFNGKIKVCEVVANVQALHCQPENENALFQAASQFNLLEMVGPHVTPEQGIDGYESDYTQGPACAIACGAGTIFRNYFVEIGQQIGQTAQLQVDCLELIGEQFNNAQLGLWTMKNGYALITQEGLLTINKILAGYTTQQREDLKSKLKVGIQWNTEVTIAPNRQKVSQIYCSALPVAYGRTHAYYWESFARVILEATYEATLFTALINMQKNGSKVAFLTLVGGGAFGNDEKWILESLTKALVKFKNTPLDVRVVSYGRSNPALVNYIDKF